MVLAGALTPVIKSALTWALFKALSSMATEWGLGSREARVAMIFELMEAAEGRWRRLNGYRLVPLVKAGARFVNG